jgi:hypothetical protein
MPNVFCLLNHELTPKQKGELYSLFGTEIIIYPTSSISEYWSGIPVDRELSKERLEPFTSWLHEAKQGDALVLQGEHSATFALADFALQKGLVPVCAVTKRVSQEIREGERVCKTYEFEHICFRKYKYYKDLK